MILVKIRCWLLILLILPALTGCSYIKSLFPDKERDYQFRTEIPELIVPDDLKPGASANKLPVPKPVAAAQEVVPAVSPPVQSSATQATAPASNKQPESQPKTENNSDVQVVASSADVSSLLIDQPEKQAWRLVARALGRQRIEIAERNLDKAYFYVKYDPDAVKPEDKTIWDEITFVFGEDPSHEKAYRISLLEIGPQSTEVTVQNSEGKTVSTVPATRLLKLIADNIKQETPGDTEDKATSP